MHISSVATLSASQRQAIIDGLTDKQAEALLYDWPFWARPNQLAPEGEWFCWFIRAGRGFGKTRTGSEWVIDRAKNGPYHPIALVGQTKADVRDTMVELGESSILRCSPPWFYPKYEPSKRRLVWPNGMIAMIYSGDEPDQLRGPQHGSAWVDELAKFRYPKETWDNLELGLRLGDNPQVAVTTTPRPIPIIQALLKDPATVDVTGSSYDNFANLSPRFIERITARYEGTRLGRQELHGQILEDNPLALWKRQTIEDSRVHEFPELKRIVVGIDPQAKKDVRNRDEDEVSETGIVIAGISDNGHGYILDDVTLNGTPDEWGRAAVAAYNKHRADRIIAEVNNGGDMVEFTVKTVAPNVAFKQVRASKGKHTRAEPVAALYEQGKVHHVGMFAEMEDQMCQWVPGDASPDRLDALVWALTELMLEDGGAIEMTDTPDILANWRG